MELLPQNPSSPFHIGSLLVRACDSFCEPESLAEKVVLINKIQSKLSAIAAEKVAEISLFESENQKLHDVVNILTATVILESSQLCNSISELEDYTELRLNVCLEQAGSTHSLLDKLIDQQSNSAKVKLALLKAAPSINDLAERMLLGEYSKEISDWVLNTAIHLARDISLNFTNGATSTDSKLIFAEAIDPILKICLTTFQNQILSTAHTGDEPGSLTPDNAEACLHKSFAHIKQFHFGHLDTNELFESLKKSLVKTILQVKPNQHSTLAILNKGFDKLYFKAADRAVLEAWKKATTLATERVQKMSKEEYDEWFLKHGDKPMDLTEFFSLLEDALRGISLLTLSEIDFSEITLVAKDKVAAAWGLSDFLFQEAINEKS